LKIFEFRLAEAIAGAGAIARNEKPRHPKTARLIGFVCPTIWSSASFASFGVLRHRPILVDQPTGDLRIKAATTKLPAGTSKHQAKARHGAWLSFRHSYYIAAHKQDVAPRSSRSPEDWFRQHGKAA
jgi:hypothetical protein